MDHAAAAHGLPDSEDLHRSILRSMSDAVFITTDDGAFTFVSPNVDVIFGYREDEVLAMGRISRLLGDDLPDLEHLTATGDSRHIEREIRAKDGALHVLSVDVKRVSPKLGTIMHVCRDITERKHAEHVLSDLSRRLIEAHERERRRLSRELHDNVGQQLAVLSAELVMLRRQLGASPPLVDDVDRLLAHTADLGTELHRLSHDLHPAWLRHVGLSESVRRVCADLSRASRVAIHLESVRVPEAPASDVALCLYRIVQEALHNVVKHSRAANAAVRLEADDREVVLTVVDDGIGFDAGAGGAAGGVGLISMRERARQVDGHVVVTSEPGLGTCIQVRLPLVTSPESI